VPEKLSEILIINGPNLNMLGKREVEIYGKLSLEELNKKLEEIAGKIGLSLSFFQSNSEGAIIDCLQEQGSKADGIIINPGAYTHYSYAIRDAIAAISTQVVEVHMSNIMSREEFRQKSVIAPVCVGHISGFASYSYAMALSFFSDNIKS